MSKYLNFNKCVPVIIMLVLFTVAGCEQLPAEEAFYEIETSPKKLRQIEPLELLPAADGKTALPLLEQPLADEVELTLETCRAMALANNLHLKVQLIEPAIAAERVSIEEARFEAAIFSNLRYIKTDTPTATTLTGSKIDHTSVDLGVEVPLQTGGKIVFDLADGRTKTNNAFSTLDPSYNSDFSVSISHPLLRNAGKRTNTYAIRIAEYDRQITDARTKLEMIRVLAAVDRVYWRLYATRKVLEVRKQEYDLSKAQLDTARRFVEAGERPQVEIIRAEAGVAGRIEGIIIAENSLRDRQRELKRILNNETLPLEVPITLIPATDPDPVRYELLPDKLVSAAIENRMEMLELELQLAKNISTLDFLKNQALPLVTLDYTYNVNGLGPTRSDSYDMLTDKNFEDHRLGLQVLIPLGNQAAKSRLRAAFYHRKQQLTTRENRKTLIEIEVLNTVDQLEATWQRILAARQNAILSGKLFEAEKRQFEVGLRTSTDVLDAQTKFANAQSSEILALAEYQIALVDLSYATGTVLGAAKIQWHPIVPEF